MFAAAELGHKIDKELFKTEVLPLRAALLEAQFRLRAHGKFPVILIISGVDGAGKGETINILYEWMDPRYLSTHAFSSANDEERAHPFMWRFWKGLPPKGNVGIFAGSWYSEPMDDFIRGKNGKSGKSDFTARLDQIKRFETMLANEGALILKFWFHLSKDAQKKRFKALEKDKKTAWKVTKQSWDRMKTYDDLQSVAEQTLRATNSPQAPWIVVEGTDDNYRSLTVGKILLEAMQKRLEAAERANMAVKTPPAKTAPKGAAKITKTAPIKTNIDDLNVLSALDLSQSISKKSYEKELAHWQGKLSELSRHPKLQKHALVLAFEGADAAGKGSSIRRITAALDARQYQIVPIAAPTEEERAQPYLWRFWRHMPRHNRIAIFDRTWYGRVLVERVEGFCSEEAWSRAYAEINDFEHELAEDNVVLVKFWLQISPEEQLRRFKEREQIAHKRFKITEEDWRNREKSAEYHEATCDMVNQTSTANAPWTIVEANDKSFARIKVLRTICERLEAKFDL